MCITTFYPAAPLHRIHTHNFFILDASQIFAENHVIIHSINPLSHGFRNLYTQTYTYGNHVIIYYINPLSHGFRILNFQKLRLFSSELNKRRTDLQFEAQRINHQTTKALQFSQHIFLYIYTYMYINRNEKKLCLHLDLNSVPFSQKTREMWNPSAHSVVFGHPLSFFFPQKNFGHVPMIPTPSHHYIKRQTLFHKTSFYSKATGADFAFSIPIQFIYVLCVW